MWEKRTWLKLSHLSPYSPQVGECMAGVKQENGTDVNADPYNKGLAVRWLSYVDGGILQVWFGSTSLERRVTSNQYKVVLSGHLIIWRNIYILIGVDSFIMAMPPSIGYEESVNSLMSMKMMWIIFWGFHGHQISIQLNTYGISWTNILDSALHHHHQHCKWGNIFWKNGVHPSSTAPETFRIIANAHWSCSGSLWLPQTLKRHFMSFFPFSCHPSVDLSLLDLCHLFYNSRPHFLKSISMHIQVYFLCLSHCWLSLIKDFFLPAFSVDHCHPF